MVMAASFGTGQVFWSMLWFFMFLIWIWLLIVIFGDIFRSSDLSGWAKAFWVIFVVVLPWLGVLSYLIVRGSTMPERALASQQKSEQAFRQYVQETSATPANQAPSTAGELAKLADLRSDGVLSEPEFQAQKAKLLGQQPAPLRTA